MMENIKKKWYDSASTVTSLILGTIIIIIVCSQSFAVGGDFSLRLFGSVINHNSIYLLVLIYFVLLKFKIGKKYFNYINLFLVFIYFMSSIATLLTTLQAFSLEAVLEFVVNIILFIYLIHTMFRDTRIWKEYNLDKSPFNELSNDLYFYSVITITVFLLAVSLVNTALLSGVVICTLDALYLILFGRYIYLYRDYLDKNRINSINSGNFDEIRSNIGEVVDDVLDKTDIDDKIVDSLNEVKDKSSKFIKEKEIDKKIDEVKDKVEEVVQDKKKTTRKSTTKKTTRKSTTKKKGDE